MRIITLILAVTVTVCPITARANGPVLSAVQQNFMALVNKNPIQRLHAQALQSLGYTEQQYMALPADQRSAVQARAVEMMRSHIGQ
jgi:hypothetical protein